MNNNLTITNQNSHLPAGSNIVDMDEESGNMNAMVAIESSKAIQEVQASLIIAKRFPRDEMSAYNKVMNACKRPGLAEVSTYTYSRGGTEISGASIRLAEAIAQYWGNIGFGWEEIERKNGKSTIKAYCWDKETNTVREQIFSVNHLISTKKGNKVLTDERDIYENNANMAARRMRSCILALIPGDVVEAAVAQCEETLKIKTDITPDRIKKMLETFAKYDVTQAMIEKRIQRNISALTPAQFVDLGKIANSMKDGMSVAKDWFEFEAVAIADNSATPQAQATVAKEAQQAPQPTANEEPKNAEEQLESFKGKNKKASNKVEKEEVAEESKTDFMKHLENDNSVKDKDDSFPGDRP